MTRKDYILIAVAFAEARHHFWAGRTDDSAPPTFADGLKAAAEEVANALGRDNARFDRARFLTACGVQS